MILCITTAFKPSIREPTKICVHQESERMSFTIEALLGLQPKAETVEVQMPVQKHFSEDEESNGEDIELEGESFKYSQVVKYCSMSLYGWQELYLTTQHTKSSDIIAANLPHFPLAHIYSNTKFKTEAANSADLFASKAMNVCPAMLNRAPDCSKTRNSMLQSGKDFY